MKKCEDIVPNFGENRPGCFTMTTHRLTLPSSPTSFWRTTKLLLSPTHRTPLIWHPVTSSYFLKWNWSWKDAGSIPLRRFRPKRRKCLTLWQKRTFRKGSKNGGDGGTGVYIREGTTSRVTAADRPKGKFMIFTASVLKLLDQLTYVQWNFYVREWSILRFFACNKNLYQTNAKWLKIKPKQMLQIINSAKIVLIIYLHQTQITVVPEN